MTLDPLKIIQIADIPPIPQLIQQIMSLADQPSTTIQKMESLVVQEPALSTKILKWVNSALYSFPQRINSVRHAMIILGFATVRSIASGLILMNAFEDVPGIDKNYVLQIWGHGLKSAHHAKILAAKETVASQDILYLACMIQNVGCLVLRQYFGSKYDDIINQKSLPDTQTEDEILDINHAIVGAHLLREWRFSEEVINLVNKHHETNIDSEIEKFLAYMRLSSQLALNENDSGSFDFLNKDDLKIANIDADFLISKADQIKDVSKMVNMLLQDS